MLGYDRDAIIYSRYEIRRLGGVMGHDGMQIVVQGEMALAAHFKWIMYIQFEVDV